MRVAVAGGTGFIGRALVQALLCDGHEVVVLTRVAAPAAQSTERLRFVAWQPQQTGPWTEALVGVDGVINLAGEPLIGRRWTSAQKAIILSSRVAATDALVEAMRRSSTRPQVLVNASAVGYYGPHGDESLDESSPAGQGFLADVCHQWEAAAMQAESSGVRVVCLRIGVVLAPDGGALAKMAPPFTMFVGGPIGSGRQWLSWIHRDDVVGMIRWSLTHPEVRGPLNATATVPVTMRDFTQALGRAMSRPSWLPAPAFALRALLGEAADVLLTGQRVLPSVAQRLGYAFVYPALETALAVCV